MTEDEVKAAWMRGGATVPPSPQGLRAAAARFDRGIRRRNAVEYIAGAAGIAFFAWIGLSETAPLLRLACLLTVLGGLTVMWQLHRRSSPLADPVGTVAMTLIAHRRAQLARQRDALESVVWWYLLPLAPGVAMFSYAVAPARTLAHNVFAAAVVLFVFTGVWWLNRRAAADLAEEIAELDALGS